MSYEEDGGHEDFFSLLDGMTKTIGNVREVAQGLMKNLDPEMKDGISLLSLKHHLLLSYIQSLTLLIAHRALGHSLTPRACPPQPFTASSRGVRGTEAGDLVDILLEDRIILEKVKQLESKMRYQIEKLVALGNDTAGTRTDIINDPLAFRPNPQYLLEQGHTRQDSDVEVTAKEEGHDIYRPPKLAPMPYTEKKDKSKMHASIPTGLAAFAHHYNSNPRVESSTGLGSMASARARELARMNEFEEENMTRLVMTKKEARRRARDEEDVALGGTGASRGRRRGGGLEDEFEDVLKAVDRGGRGGGKDDGYEALRVKGKKQDVLARSRTRTRNDDDDGGRLRKRSRFQTAVKTLARRQRPQLNRAPRRAGT